MKKYVKVLSVSIAVMIAVLSVTCAAIAPKKIIYPIPNGFWGRPVEMVQDEEVKKNDKVVDIAEIVEEDVTTLQNHVEEIVEEAENQIVELDPVDEVQEDMFKTPEFVEDAIDVDVYCDYDDYIPRFEEWEIVLAVNLVYLEVRGESVNNWRYVASTLLNRLNNGHWGDTLYSVISAIEDDGSYAFSVFPYIYSVDYQDITYCILNEVVREVLSCGSVLEDRIMYFRSGYYHKWAIDEFNDGNVYYSSSPWMQ